MFFVASKLFWTFASPISLLLIAALFGALYSGGRHARIGRLVAALLARRFPAARLVFSGGNGALVARVSTEALEARKLLADLGVDAVRVMMEDKSRSTDENARFAPALVHPEPSQRWLLVTSAYHMTRSTGVFEKAGFNVIPHPVAYRTAGSQYGLMWDFDPARNFRVFEVAAKEWIGLAAYWATGRMDHLFPGPRDAAA